MNFYDYMTETEKGISKRLLDGDKFNFTHVRYKNTYQGAQLLEKAINVMQEDSTRRIAIHFDIDFDGISSGYIMWKMLYTILNCAPTRLVPFINRKRRHSITPDIIEEINDDKSFCLLIIVDSSTNETELLQKVNCDVLVVDHHDIEVDSLSGNTAGGQYIIINNNAGSVDPVLERIENKSAAEVVYELWENLSPDLLVKQQLEEWVAISLYSDAIPTMNEQNMWFISHLFDLRPRCDIQYILESLDYKQFRNGYVGIFRDNISFKLVPLINSCMRLERGPELLNAVLFQPHRLNMFKDSLTKQRDLVYSLNKLASKEIYNNVVLAKINKQAQTSIGINSAGLSELMKISHTNAILASVNSSVLEGFNGVIASQLANKHGTVALVYSIIEDNGKQFMKGSVRTEGDFKDIELRKRLNILPGWTALGHGDAFGFTFDLSYGDIHKAADDVANAVANIEDIERHQTVYNLTDYNICSRLVNSTDKEELDSLKAIACLNNVKTNNDRYYFTFTVGSGFIKPELEEQISGGIATYRFSGTGEVEIKLTAFGDRPQFNIGETYKVYFESINNNIVLGTIEVIQS